MQCVAIAAAVLLSACGGSGSNVNGGGGTGNRPPTISGDPASSVIVGDLYSFTPVATDADGDPLSFTIQNSPGWANFDAASGTISGTPLMGDIGTYQNIVISVSDGQLSDSLPDFGIDVTQVGTASATLSWAAPTRNNDGSPLADLAGYIIFYGKSSGNYSNQIRVDNPSITNYVVDGLTGGTYYFAAKTFNSAGVESEFSGEASATLTES